MHLFIAKDCHHPIFTVTPNCTICNNLNSSMNIYVQEFLSFKNKLSKTNYLSLSKEMYNLNFYYQNVRGLRSKLFNLHSNFVLLSYDIFLLTETWLSDDINNAELNFSGYTIFRCDRSIHSSNLSRGGGVLIAVRNNLRPQLVPTGVQNVEQLFVRISVTNELSALISVVYIPPSPQCKPVTSRYLYEICRPNVGII